LKFYFINLILKFNINIFLVTLSKLLRTYIKMTLIHNNQSTNIIYCNEPIKKTISWQPIKNNGIPLTNMILKSIEGTLELRLNILSRFLYFSLIILGSFLLFYATIALLSYNFLDTLWSITLGFLFTGIGIYTFSIQALPHKFDKEKNLYFKQNENLERENETPLHDIHALQIISYTQENEGKKEQQAELNLILKNGKRVYVCSYKEEEYTRIKQDTQKIAQYINKPIWTRGVQ